MSHLDGAVSRGTVQPSLVLHHTGDSICVAREGVIWPVNGRLASQAVLPTQADSTLASRPQVDAEMPPERWNGPRGLTTIVNFALTVEDLCRLGTGGGLRAPGMLKTKNRVQNQSPG